MRYSTVLPMLLACGVLPASNVAAQDWKDSLTARLKTELQISKIASDAMRITESGSVYLIAKDGVSGSPSSDKTYLIGKYENGRVQQAKGVAAFLLDKNDTRDFKIGDHVYVTGASVKNDNIVIQFVSAETFDKQIAGSTKQTRFKGAINFPFEKGTLQTLDSATVRGTIGEVFTSQAAADAPKSIELGQTIEQVEASLGKPSKIIKLGTKTIYVYADLKVTFTDGKVTDVQ